MTYLIDKSLEEVVVTLPMLNRYCRDLPLVQATAGYLDEKSTT
jgi:hypothetical protein